MPDQVAWHNFMHPSGGAEGMGGVLAILLFLRTILMFFKFGMNDALILPTR